MNSILPLRFNLEEDSLDKTKPHTSKSSASTAGLHIGNFDYKKHREGGLFGRGSCHRNFDGKQNTALLSPCVADHFVVIYNFQNEP